MRSSKPCGRALTPMSPAVVDALHSGLGAASIRRSRQRVQVERWVGQWRGSREATVRPQFALEAAGPVNGRAFDLQGYGGYGRVVDAKQRIRERIWRTLEDEGAARFPGARGRIPNFRGAEAAAERLAELPEWKAAAVVKSNPDSPQLPARRRAP